MIALQVAGGIILALVVIRVYYALTNVDLAQDIKGWKAALVIGGIFAVAILLPFIWTLTHPS